MNEQKQPLPPFTEATAKQKIQMAEDAWNSMDPVTISMAYAIDSEWRNRTTFVNGREDIQTFLKEKWDTELDYKLKKDYWSHSANRIAVRFEYEYRLENGQWYRAYGNENWEFNANGLMTKRYASINDVLIHEKDRTLKNYK
jgi:nuclear transport factor 2 (NTF2) superfamily protein|nr:nuclear transport factor 2 family protein [uncultured Psychroserpens sp.]